MRDGRRVRKQRKRLNDRGSALIMAMTILSFIAILGALAMGTALLNVRARGLNRQSDKNFYLLETALDEIYAQTGERSSEILKEKYAEIVGKLYQEGYQTNEEANQMLKKNFMEALTKELNINLQNRDGNFLAQSECEQAAETLKTFASSFTDGLAGAADEAGLQDPSGPFGSANPSGQPGSAALPAAEDLEVSLGAIMLQEKDPDAVTAAAFGADTDSGDGDGYAGLVLQKLRLIYTNPDTGIESALTVDLRVNVPYVRFINEGSALLDYVMVANKGIEVNKNGGKANGSGQQWNGKIYGGEIVIDAVNVEVNSSLMTAAGNLTVKNNSLLTVQPEQREDTGDTGGEPTEMEPSGSQSRVWASGIELNTGSKLESEDTSFYIQDDMTLKGGDNEAILGGNYYGYGNEGEGAERKAIPSNSSAILLNDKNSKVDLTSLDSLLLAGRAYLNFNNQIGENQYVYPMGESLAVRPTQTMYLIPEGDIQVDLNDKKGFRPAGSNPIALFDSETETSVMVKVKVSADETGSIDKEGSYKVTIPAAGGTAGGTGTAGGAGMAGGGSAQRATAEKIPSADPGTGTSGTGTSDTGADDPAVFVYMNGKLYVYYNFVSDEERSGYFEHYLETKGTLFESLLKKAGMGDGTSGVEITGGGAQRIATSGSLYQVWANGEGGKVFEPLYKRQDEVSSSLSWVQFEESLAESFKNIKYNLAETVRLSGRIDPSAAGAAQLLPAGNFVRMDKIQGLSGGFFFQEKDGCAVYLTDADIGVYLGADGTAQVSAGKGTQKEMAGGLIISSKNVTVQDGNGAGTFDGLIIAGGTLLIDNPKVTLTANADTYEPILEEKEVAEYFYDYSDPASTVLNDYEDFVIKENWSRTGRETETGGGE